MNASPPLCCVVVNFFEENGELLSMIPPTIEALMDIMEGSKDLTELLGNEVAPDVVDQTRDLVQQVIKKVRTQGLLFSLQVRR